MGRLLSESISHGKGSALPSLQSSNTTKQEETDAWMARSMSRFQSRASLLLLSLPLCSPISLSLSLSPLAIAQDTSLENKLDLFIGVIKKTKKKESVVTRSVKNQNCHFIRAMNLFFFHRFQLYTGSPNFTFRFFPDSFLLFLFPSPLPLPVCHISRKNGKQHGNDKRAVR